MNNGSGYFSDKYTQKLTGQVSKIINIFFNKLGYFSDKYTQKLTGQVNNLFYCRMYITLSFLNVDTKTY